MSMNKLFESVEATRQGAQWRAAFGEPETIEGKTVIPVAKVGYGFGLGFGQGGPPPEAGGEPVTTGEGGGGGGGAMANPLGVIVVTDEGVHFEPIMDQGKLAMAGILMSALFLWQLAKTLRAIFGRS